MSFHTFAAIDIGSNAIRLLINNIEEGKGVPEFKKIAFLRVPIRLGEDTFSKGFIDENKAERLHEALSGFAHIMRAYQVSSYMACATSAMRDAGNGEQIVREIRENSSIDIRIISGKEEAEMIFQAGKLNAVIEPDKNYLYVDVGGGSTEIVLYSRQTKVDSRSFQIGTVRMLADKVSKEEKNNFKEWLKNVYEKYAPLYIIASGGNINKIHKMLGKTSKDVLLYTELRMLYDMMKELTYEERIHNFKLNNYRADVIIPAMKIFLTAGKACKVNQIYVPKVGLADGIIHHLYREQEKSRQ
ncbi:MAG: hypothetical protein LIP08_01255 [Bacteroides sp.]|nr:hypothetical protein [Bacteroides sp.]